MLDLKGALRHLLMPSADWETAERTSHKTERYNRDSQKPVLKCSICNGEQVAGFKDIRTGKFEEVTLIRSEKELKDFMETYGIDEISKEY